MHLSSSPQSLKDLENFLSNHFIEFVEGKGINSNILAYLQRKVPLIDLESETIIIYHAK